VLARFLGVRGSVPACPVVIVAIGLLWLAEAAPAQRPVPEPVAVPAPGTYQILSGEVTGIDNGRGTVRIRTDAGEMDLPLPPGGLGNIRVGDRLDVRIELRPSAASPTPPTPPTPPAPGDE